MSVVKCPVYFFSCRLAHSLTSDVRQVGVLIVRFMISPHHKDNLEPLRPQSPERLGMAVSLGSLIPIVGVGPFALVERDKRQPVRGVHVLVTGKTKLYRTALAVRFGHRHHARLGLKVAKRLPATLRRSMRPEPF